MVQTLAVFEWPALTLRPVRVRFWMAKAIYYETWTVWVLRYVYNSLPSQWKQMTMRPKVFWDSWSLLFPLEAQVCHQLPSLHQLAKSSRQRGWAVTRS